MVSTWTNCQLGIGSLHCYVAPMNVGSHSRRRSSSKHPPTFAFTLIPRPPASRLLSLPKGGHQCDPDVGIKSSLFTKSCPKSSQISVFIIRYIFQVGQKVAIHLGYFCLVTLRCIVSKDPNLNKENN